MQALAVTLSDIPCTRVNAERLQDIVGLRLGGCRSDGVFLGILREFVRVLLAQCGARNKGPRPAIPANFGHAPAHSLDTPI